MATLLRTEVDRNDTHLTRSPYRNLVRSRATTSRRPAERGSDAHTSSANATRSASEGAEAGLMPGTTRISRCGASWLTRSHTVTASSTEPGGAKTPTM